MAAQWELKGHLLAACSCDWGCPCSFDARPTKGFCEGGYVWHITHGMFESTALEGISFSWMIHSPGPLHEGNVTSIHIIDEKATPQQRKAIQQLMGGKEGVPWAIFAAVTSKYLEPQFAKFDVTIAGLRSKVRAGSYIQMELGPIVNPVSGNEEQLQLRKPTGFTSKWADLGKSTKFAIATPGLRYDHSNQYAEFSEFHYTQNGPQ